MLQVIGCERTSLRRNIVAWDRRKGFWVVSHLQGDNAAELCWRIIDDVGEIAVESNEHGIEALRAVNHVRIFRVYWQVTAQQLNCVSDLT